MAERSEVCTYCKQEVPVGKACNSKQAVDCPDRVGPMSQAVAHGDDVYLSSDDDDPHHND